MGLKALVYHGTVLTGTALSDLVTAMEAL